MHRRNRRHRIPGFSHHSGADGAGCIVIALGRPGAYENLKARLKSLWWNFPTRRDALEERVIAVECDIAQPNLGLSDEALQLLTERATHFVHAAADVRRKTSDLLKRYYPW